MDVTRKRRAQGQSEFKSVRLEPRLRERLREAARVAEASESDLIREAIERRVDEILGDRLDRRLADVIGAGRGGGSGHSRRTGKAFTEILRRKRRLRSSTPDRSVR